MEKYRGWRVQYVALLPSSKHRREATEDLAAAVGWLSIRGSSQGSDYPLEATRRDPAPCPNCKKKARSLQVRRIVLQHQI
jgi:hypothetical protein